MNATPQPYSLRPLRQRIMQDEARLRPPRQLAASMQLLRELDRAAMLAATPPVPSSPPASPQDSRDSHGDSPLSGSAALRMFMHGHHDWIEGAGNSSDADANDASSNEDSVHRSGSSGSDSDPGSGDGSEDGVDADDFQRPTCCTCLVYLLCLMVVVVSAAIVLLRSRAPAAKPTDDQQCQLLEPIPCVFFPDLNRLLNTPHGRDSHWRHFPEHYLTEDLARRKPRWDELVQMRAEKRDSMASIIQTTLSVIQNNSPFLPHFLSRSIDTGCALARAVAQLTQTSALDAPLSWLHRAKTEAGFLAEQHLLAVDLERWKNSTFDLLQGYSKIPFSSSSSTAADDDVELVGMREWRKAVEDDINNRRRPAILISILSIVKLQCWISSQEEHIAAIREPWIRELSALAYQSLLDAPNVEETVKILQRWENDLGELDRKGLAAHEGVLNPGADVLKAERKCATDWAERHLSHCALAASAESPPLMCASDPFFMEWHNHIPFSFCHKGKEDPDRIWTRYLLEPGSKKGRQWLDGTLRAGSRYKQGGGVLVDLQEDTPRWPGMMKWWRAEASSEE